MATKPFKLILPFDTLETFRGRIAWLVNLRWIGIMVLLGIIPIVEQTLLRQLGYPQIYTLIALWTGLNLLYFFLCKYLHFQDFIQEILFTELQVIGDFILLSFLIHYTGGIGNPFYFIFLVHIIISGILFEGGWPYFNATLAAFLMTVWSILEYSGAVQVYALTEHVISRKFYVTAMGGSRNGMRGYGRSEKNKDNADQYLEAKIVETLLEKNPKQNPRRTKGNALGSGLQTIIDIRQPH